MRYSLLLLCLALTPAWAQLDGRVVVLVVGDHRQEDQRMVKLERHLTELRARLGLGKGEMPLVFMGFNEVEVDYFGRLGFHQKDGPVVCVAEWGNPARFGPKRVVDGAIARAVEGEDAVARSNLIMRRWLELEGHADKVALIPRPPGAPTQTTGKLELRDVQFEANGKPLYLVNARARVKNIGEQAVEKVSVEFAFRLPGQAGWRMLGRQSIGRIPGGYVVARDLVADTREVGLLDQQHHIRACDYRVRVVYGQETLVEEGHFVPRELQSQ